MFLTLVQFANALFQRGEIQRRFGNENDVGLTIGRPERDEPCLPAHDLDNRNAAMTFRRGANPPNPLCHHEHRRGVTGCGVVDDRFEVERVI